MEHDLNDVLVFSRVVDAGSFTGAARQLGLPKSTVSRRISRLEDHLGVRLLQRTTRKLSLTDAGRLYYDRSARIVAELEDAERVVSEMQEQPRGRLRVTAPMEMGERLWLTITAFLEAYPEVELSLDLTNRYVNLVEEGFDVAIRAGTLSDSSLIARRLEESRFILVASPSYLEKRGVPAQLEDLKDHDCIAFSGRSVGHHTWHLQGPDGEVQMRIKGRLILNHLDMVKRAAIAGLGIGMVPNFYLAPEFESERLIEVLPGCGGLSSPISLVYPSTRHLAPKIRAFVDFMVEHYQALAAQSMNS